jgi:DNA-binding NtrC family response regulator
MNSLQRYDLPGNVRESSHEMKRIVVLARGPLVTEDDLSPEIRKASRTSGPPSRSLPPEASLKAAVEELGRHMVQEALVASGYNQVWAARRLGLSRQALIKKRKLYGITPRAGTI